jgi:hypothetical protein
MTSQPVLPERLALNLDNIGVLGFVAGPDVYLFDSLSLANPIGSHTTVAVRGIPGHEKSIGQEWMIARFGLPGEAFPHLAVFGLLPRPQQPGGLSITTR